MKNYVKGVEEVIYNAQRDAIYQVIDALIAEKDKISRLIHNGDEIFYQSTGKGFLRLYDGRKRLWVKIDMLDKAITVAFNQVDELRKSSND